MAIERAAIDRAIAWRAAHSAYVSRLLESCTVAVEPSGQDRHHPEWWKAVHWRWLDTACVAGEKIWR